MAGDRGKRTGECRESNEHGCCGSWPRRWRTDGRRWLQSTVQPSRARRKVWWSTRSRIISVVAMAVAFWALLQVAMNAIGQRTVTAVNDVK